MERLVNALRFCLRDLVSDSWRTIITVLNLFIFICSYFCLAALAKAADQYGQQESNKNSLMVLSKNVFDPGDSRITLEQFAPLHELQPEMVQQVSPLIFRLMKINNYFIQVRAAPLQDFEQVYSLTVLDGRLLPSSNEVVIGENTSLQTKWKIGDSIRIFGRDFTIVGVVRSPGTKSSSVWMSLEAAESLFGTHDVYQIAWVQVAPEVEAQVVMDILTADPRVNSKFDVYFVDYLYAQYSRGLEDLATIGNLLVILALTVVMFGTYGSTYLTLAERSREITILRAVGFGSPQIRVLLMTRTYIQLIIAYLLAWGVSVLILNYLQIQHPLTVHAIPLDISITGAIVGMGFILTLIFGAVGVLIPTWNFKHTSIHQSIER